MYNDVSPEFFWLPFSCRGADEVLGVFGRGDPRLQVRQHDHVDAQAGLERAFGVDVFLGDEAGVLPLPLDVLVVPPGGLQERAADVRALLPRVADLDNTSILERSSTCNL